MNSEDYETHEQPNTLFDILNDYFNYIQVVGDEEKTKLSQEQINMFYMMTTDDFISMHDDVFDATAIILGDDDNGIKHGVKSITKYGEAIELLTKIKVLDDKEPVLYDDDMNGTFNMTKYGKLMTDNFKGSLIDIPDNKKGISPTSIHVLLDCTMVIYTCKYEQIDLEYLYSTMGIEI